MGSVGTAVPTELRNGGLAMKPMDTHRADGLSRRKFIERLGLSAAVGGASGLGLPALAWADAGDAGPIDCGPPPKAKPQHQTGGESFPPLPLPATPLRRSEKKRPPSPPALIGKAGLGSTPLDHPRWQADPISRLDDRSGRRYDAAQLDLAKDGDQLSGDRRRFRSLLFRSPRTADVALGRAQQVRVDRRGATQPRAVRDGRRHHHRRCLLRLERFCRVVSARVRGHLPRPAAPQTAARGPHLRLLLQVGQPEL